MTDAGKFARHYAGIGLALVPIPHGLKGPREAGWNDPANAITTKEAATNAFQGQCLNMGVLHSVSGTATLDIDHAEWAAEALAAVGIDLAELMTARVRIRGKNGEKPFYRLTADDHFDRRSLAWPHPTEVMSNGRPKLVTVLELRAGAVQDVLPPSIHPDTGLPYEWAGQPPRKREDIPELPDSLRHIWENWEQAAAQMRQACPWAAPEQPAAPRHAPTRMHSGEGAPEGSQRPGDVFRAQVNIRTVLERNGYQRKGDRYLPPDSKTKVAGVRILTGDDGVERAFSDHGSCPLNDEHAHDSFSALVLLEHAGNLINAVKAAAAEMGLERSQPAPQVAAPIQILNVEDVQGLWSAAQSDLITKGCAVLDNAQGNPKQKSSLFDLWAAVTEIACTSVWERRGKFYINPGGLLNLKAHGVTGHPADVSSRLRHLGTLGFHRGVIRLDPADKYSQILIEIPADPADLPFMAYTLEGSKSLIVQVPPRYERKAEKIQRNLPTTSKARPKGSWEDTLCFSTARQTVAWLIACPGATISELAEMRGKHPEVIRRHVRVLKSAGLVRRESKGIYLTGSWTEYRALLRLERENSDTFRRGVEQALRRTISFCRASLYGRERPPVTQSKRRKAMLSVAELRLERLQAGEPVSEVMGLAA